MISGDSIDNPGEFLASKSFRPEHPSSTKTLSLGNGKPGPVSRPYSSSDGLKCSHCGNLKHTQDTCFKLHGYPDWWNELRARKRRDTPGSTGGNDQAAVATADAPHLSLSSLAETSKEATPPTDSGNLGTALCSSSQGENRSSWVVDSGASDHMTFDGKDIAQFSQPQRTCVANANGVLSPVAGVGTVNLSPGVGSTTWMTSAWARHTTCIIQLTIKKGRFGCGIVG
jgi:hypothetical protein